MRRTFFFSYFATLSAGLATEVKLAISLLELEPKRYGWLTSYCSLSTISNIEVGRVLSLHERRGNGILPPAMRREKIQ